MRSVVAVLLALASSARADNIAAGLHLGGNDGQELYVGVDAEYERPLSRHVAITGWIDAVSVTERDDGETDASGHRVGAVAALRFDALGPEYRVRPYVRVGGGFAWAELGDYRGVGPSFDYAFGADARLVGSVRLRAEVGATGYRFDGSDLDGDLHAVLLVAVDL